MPHSNMECQLVKVFIKISKAKLLVSGGYT
jgi:hypothetical protein